jgi:hypothetical protein
VYVFSSAAVFVFSIYVFAAPFFNFHGGGFNAFLFVFAAPRLFCAGAEDERRRDFTVG